MNGFIVTLICMCLCFVSFFLGVAWEKGKGPQEDHEIEVRGVMGKEQFHIRGLIGEVLLPNEYEQMVHHGDDMIIELLAMRVRCLIKEQMNFK